MKDGTYPWLPLYVSEWLLVPIKEGLSLAEQGAFIRLLCLQWDKGGLPDDPVALARMSGCLPEEFAPIWRQLERLFPVHDDGSRQNENLERVREKHIARSSKAQSAAAARWANGDQEPKKPKSTPKQPRKPKPVAKESDIQSIPDPDPSDVTPFAKAARVLLAVSREMQGSPVVRADVLRHCKPDAPLSQLVAMFDESEVVAMYLYAAKHWTTGASWHGVHAQRDNIRRAMKGGGKQSKPKKTLVERGAELGLDV